MNFFSGSDALDKAREFLRNEAREVSGGCDRIIVENQTKYYLEYVTHGKITGDPVGDVRDSFSHTKGEHIHILKPGYVGTQLWKENTGRIKTILTREYEYL